MVTDEQLVRLMAAGDQLAFEAFIRRYHGPLLGYLDRLLHNGQKAEDLAQETFIRLIRQLRQGGVPERIKPWLYQVAKNLCRDYWRSGGYKTDSSLTPELPDRPDERTSVVELYERQETRKELVQVLEELSEVQRDVVMLRFFQDLKLQEIAEVLELPLGTVKAHLYQSLRKLKKRLSPEPKSIDRKEGACHA